MSILVVGALHLDVIVTAPHLPALDETIAGSAVDYVFGGKGGNQAIAASRMGAAVHFAGRAGSDSFGELLRNTLATSNVDIRQLQQDPGASGMSVAVLNSGGEYGAVIVSAANLNIDATPLVIPADCKIMILQNEIPDAVNLSMAQKAKAAGAQVWLNAAPARILPSGLVALADLIIVNRVEASFYAQTLSSAETIKTLGAEGVFYRGEHFNGRTVEVTSTHGSGDMFVGALAAEVAAGTAITTAIEFAQTAAALHVSCKLADRAKLNRQAVLSFGEN